MNKPSDPMQGFLEQLLQDWETGGTKTPAAPVKPAKAPVGTIMETPGVASVVRALPELAEAISLSAADELPAAPALVVAAPVAPPAASAPVAGEPAPTVALTPWPSLSWEPSPSVAPVAEAPKAEQPVSKSAFHWKPLAELARTEPPSPEATPVKVVVPTQDSVATTPAPSPAWEGEAAAFAPPPPEHAKPVLQWKPAPPPSGVAAGSKAEAAAADPLADTAPQFSKPTFQWKPAPPTPAAVTAPEDRHDNPSSPAPEQPKPAFQWKLAQPSSASPAAASAAPPVVAEPETPAVASDAPPAAPAPLAVTAVSSATPALVDFAAALSALKASRPTAAPAPVPEVEPEIVEVDTVVVEPAAQLIEELAVVEVEPEAAVTAPEPTVFLLPAYEPEIAPEPAAETAALAPQVDDQPEAAVNSLVSELPNEESAAMVLAADEEALLTSLLYEQKASPAYDLWDEPVPEAEPSAMFEPEVLTEPEAAFEPEESTAAEAVFEPQTVVALEAVLEPEALVQPEAVVEPPAEVIELEPKPSAAPPQRAFGLQSLTPAEPEWEEIALPPTPATSGNGKELASAVSHFETSLPAGQWDQSAGTRRLDLRRHLVFSINDEKFAVNLDNLVEIDNMPTWTGIPGLPNSVRGLINLRGEIVSLLELRAILGLPHPEVPKKGKIFVATTSDRQAVSAFAVDDIEGIVGFDPARMTAIPDLTATKAARNITATVEDGDRLIRILDVGGVLTEIEQTFSLDQVWM